MTPTVPQASVPAPGVERSVTSRGFIIYDKFEDDHGHSLRVQQSSSAEAAKVWVFIEDTRDLPSPPHCTTPDHLHLTVEMATRLRDALDTFIGECGDEPIVD